MGLTVEEIRDRAERLRSALVEEMLEGFTGRKPWPEYAPLYAGQRVLAWEASAPVIERELASSSGERERRLRRLLAWAAEHQVRAATAPLDDEFSHWHATAAVDLDGRRVPVGQLRSMIQAEQDRAARDELTEVRAQAWEEVGPLQLDRLNRWRTAAAELGYGPYREAVQRLGGLNLAHLASEAERLLAATRGIFAVALDLHLDRWLGLAKGEARAHDIDWLSRMDWLEAPCDEATILAAIRRDLAAIGLDLEEDGRVDLDVEPFPGPGMRATCAPVRVPDRVVLFVTPTTTPKACRSLLREVGEALHWSRTDPSLPFEYRAIGDVAVAEAVGFLFADLAVDRDWVREVRGLDGQRLDDYLEVAAFLDLFHLRRVAGRLLFDIEVCVSERPGSLGPRWAERMEEATGLRYDPRLFLERIGQRLGTARELRARILAALLGRSLRERFGARWYRDPGAGAFLRSWMAGGLSRNADERAALLGVERLGTDLLVDGLRERLA
ncbi:MAG: hypothetical protein RRA92_10300 [Gemmatimonadota bacterium]|nr:hypothetical protein [Gemmatimonadota bacterium]